MYEFGPFQLDPIKRLLFRERDSVSLPPKAFDLLLLLIENSGRVVDRNELMEKLWPDTFVEEINLNVHISSLRKALGEQPSEHSYIVTVPRRGYSFVATVRKSANGDAVSVFDDDALTGNSYQSSAQESETDSEADKEASSVSAVFSPRPFLRRRIFVISVLSLIVMAAASYIWISARRRPVDVQPSGNIIAVLPFKQLSPAINDHTGLGMADALITKLSNIKEILVRPTSAVLRYDNAEADSLKAGRELGANLLLEGKIQRSGDRIRVTVQMLKVEDGSALWAESFDEKFTDIFAIEDSISRRVAKAVSARLNAEEESRLAKHFTENVEAYQAYIKGRYFWNKRTYEGLRKAKELFEQAIELDPAYAMAYAGLADAYNLLTIFGGSSPHDTYPKAKAAAMKALEIDPTLAEAHNSLAYTLMRYDWDWKGAEEEFKRALDLNPNYATAHHWYGEYLTLTGKTGEAVAETRKALELDPLSVIINSDLGWVLYYAGDYDDAINQCRKTLEMDPDFVVARLALGLAYEEKGLYEEALAQFKYKDMEKWYPTRIAHIMAVSGRKKRALEIIKPYEAMAKQDPRLLYGIAGVYAGLGDKDQTMRLLEQAYADHQELLIYLKVDPRFYLLRSDGRFQDLLRRMGFQDEKGATIFR